MTGGGVKGVGRADAWATLTACGQGICSQSAPSRPPPQAPSLILSCLPLPRKSPPLPGEASPPPRPRPASGGTGEGAGGDQEGLENSGRFFFPPGDPLTTSPLRSTQVSLSGLRERRPELGKG